MPFIYDERTLEKAFRAMSDYRDDLMLREMQVEIELLSIVNDESIKNLPVVSFWKNPSQYISNAMTKRIYNKVVNKFVTRLDSEDKKEQYSAHRFLKLLKDYRVLPKKISDKLNEFPDDYASKLELELQSK